MSLKYQVARIVAGDNTFRTRRAAMVPEGAFAVADDCYPGVRVGEAVVVKYDTGDQFATLVPYALVKYRNPRGEGYLQLTPSTSKLPEGHLAAHAVGGGFVKSVPIADIVEWETVLPRLYKFGPVGFEGEAYVKAYYNPLDTWNGWLKPYVDRENLELFIKQQDELAAGGTCDCTTGKMDGDVAVFSFPDDPKEPTTERVEPEVINFDGKEVTVWQIGCGLVWDEAEVVEPLKGPRFVWIIGSIREEYPDIPEAMEAQTVLYDRQERKPVATVFGPYDQAICLEHANYGTPFTSLEKWFNNLTDESLASEGLPVNTQVWEKEQAI